jgi:polar amino acid transport system substrate-binding protein
MLRRVLIAITAVAALASPVPATAQVPAPPSGATLKVGTRVLPPFVTRDDAGKLDGFSIELWNAIAARTGIASEYVVAGNVGDLLADVSAGKTDLGIAAISITAERERIFDFSQPMFDGGLQIAVAATPSRDSDPISAFLGFVLSKSFLEIIAVILILMLVPAPFIWLVERRTGQELLDARTPLGQFGQAIWWSICALGGQAQDMPSRTIGRMIAVPWLMFAVLFASYFTAAVTTRMTVKQLERGIEGPQDLPGRSLVTVANSTAAAWLRSHSLAATEVRDIETAVQMIVSGDAQAVIYDAPVLAYLASHDKRGLVKTVGRIFKPQHYGVVFLPGAALRRTVDEALLHLKETGEYQSMKQKWFAEGEL